MFGAVLNTPLSKIYMKEIVYTILKLPVWTIAEHLAVNQPYEWRI